MMFEKIVGFHRRLGLVLRFANVTIKWFGSSLFGMSLQDMVFQRISVWEGFVTFVAGKGESFDVFFCVSSQMEFCFVSLATLLTGPHPISVFCQCVNFPLQLHISSQLLPISPS